MNNALERRWSHTNQARIAAVTALQHDLAVWPSLTDDRARGEWIELVNDRLLRSLPGVRVAFMVDSIPRQEPLAEAKQPALGLALLVPTCLMRFLVGRPALWYPSVVVVIDPDGALVTMKNRYGTTRLLDSLESAQLSDPGCPPVTVRFTTIVPEER